MAMAGIVPIHSIHIVSSIVFYLPAPRAKVKKASKTVRAWGQATCSVARSQEAGLEIGKILSFSNKIFIFELLWYKLTFIILGGRMHRRLKRSPVSLRRALNVRDASRAGHKPATLRDSSERLREQ